MLSVLHTVLARDQLGKLIQFFSGNFQEFSTSSYLYYLVVVVRFITPYYLNLYYKIVHFCLHNSIILYRVRNRNVVEIRTIEIYSSIPLSKPI